MNLREMSYQEMMAAATYSVVRTNRGKESIERAGMKLEDARALCAELSAAEEKAHPELTNWTIDHFEWRLEQGEEINRELHRRRMERCS